MTFREAQVLAERYLKIIGTKAITRYATVVAIIIRKVSEEDYEPVAFFYGGGSHASEEPLHLHEHKLSWGEKRLFSVYIDKLLPYSITAHGNIITNCGEKWMVGKTLEEIKPYLTEKKAKVYTQNLPFQNC